jgi:hypothetical protein
MTLWGANGAASSNSVKWAAESIDVASGHANIVSNNTALYQNTTPGGFPSGRNAGAPTIGQFGASKTQINAKTTNTSSEGGKITIPGWHLRRAGEGGIQTAPTGANGVFTNGEFIIVSGGTANGRLSVTTNSQGNLVSTSLVTPGLFANTSSMVFTFERDQHLGSPGVAVTAPGGAYTNGDVLTVANGFVNAVYVLTTNAAGNIASLAVNAAASGPGGAGLWGNAGSFGGTGNLVFSIANSTGGASLGTGATFTGNLQTSTGGAINASSTVLGGRAGRVHYEALAVVKGLANGTSAQLPNT